MEWLHNWKQPDQDEGARTQNENTTETQGEGHKLEHQTQNHDSLLGESPFFDPPVHLNHLLTLTFIVVHYRIEQ